MDLAYSLTGRYREVLRRHIVSSAMMGTVSGPAIANVVTTGTFTIPLMKIQATRLILPGCRSGSIYRRYDNAARYGTGAFIMAQHLSAVC